MRLLAFLFLLISAVSASAQAPGPPTNLAAAAIGAGDVRLTWTAPAGTPIPRGYHVYRTLSPSGTFGSPITVFDQVTGQTFTDTTATVGTAYKYMVRAYVGLAAGEELTSTNSNEATVTPVDTPGIPLNLRSTTITSTTISLTWGSVSGAVSYNVYQDGELIDNVTTNSYTAEELEFSTSYEFEVTAVSSAGEESDPSNTLTVSTFGDGSKKAAAFARQFRRVDVNADGQLSEAEYIAVHGARLAWVIAYNRFFYSDKDSSGSLSLTEYAKALGGRKYFAPSKSRQFNLADQDDDGELTVDEYALLKPARMKPAKVAKSFLKRDEDESESLTPEELKIRNYVSEDEEEL